MQKNLTTANRPDMLPVDRELHGGNSLSIMKYSPVKDGTQMSDELKQSLVSYFSRMSRPTMMLNYHNAADLAFAEGLVAGAHGARSGGAYHREVCRLLTTLRNHDTIVFEEVRD